MQLLRDASGTRASRWRFAMLVSFAGALVLACLLHLNTTPPLWWDEGWTLSVARHWVERGHYGQMQNGALAQPGLAAAPTVVVPIALSFRTFGIGTWQGRLPGILYTIGALFWLYSLADSVFGKSVARASVAAALIAPFAAVHPIFLGRQALAELPMLFFLVGGYAVFFGGAKRSNWRVVVAILMWGTALATKLQPLPFFSASLVVALLYAVKHKRWRLSGVVATSLVASVVVSQLLKLLFGWFISSPGVPIPGLYEVTALLPFARAARYQAFAVAVSAGLPTLWALAYFYLDRLRRPDDKSSGFDRRMSGLTLAAFVLSWFGWYATLSLGSTRYLFPALFVGSVFVGVMLADFMTALRALIQRARAPQTPSGRSLRRVVPLMIGAAIVASTLPFAARTALGIVTSAPDGSSAIRVADYLDTHAAPAALIETYESELFFLLHRRYHYPPDELHVDLIRRTSLGEPMEINYDPLRLDPDYLVLGPQDREWRLYRQALAAASFRLILTDGLYEVYERIR